MLRPSKEHKYVGHKALCNKYNWLCKIPGSQMKSKLYVSTIEKKVSILVS